MIQSDDLLHRKMYLWYKNSNTEFVLLFIFLSLAKILLVSDQSLYSYYGPHDDLLFLRHADSLLQLNWLGEYNNLTLIKGIGYPLWVALSKLISVDLLLSQHFLYIISCLVFVLVVRPLIYSKAVIFFLLFFLIFNPVSFTDSVGNRVIRDGIYPALSLLTFSLFLKILLSFLYEGRVKPIYSYLFGVLFSFFWITREEGLWVFPSLVFMLVCCVFYIKPKIIRKELPGVIFRPFLIFISVNFLIASLNYSNYGVFEVVDIKSAPFLSAYGSLYRVKDGSSNNPVIDYETRLKIYSVSPSFESLRTVLENKNKWWFQRKDDIQPGMFLWGLREAVKDKRYYESAIMANDYYFNLADEVDEACELGKLICREKRETLLPMISGETLKLLVPTIYNTLVYAISFDGHSSDSSVYPLSMRDKAYFEEMTGERIAIKADAQSYKSKFMDVIAWVYSMLMLPGFVLSIIIISLSFFYSKQLRIIQILSFSILLLVLTRVVLVSTIDLTAFNAINMLYLASAYPFLIAFTILNLGLAIDLIMNKNIFKRFSSERHSERCD